MGMLVLALGSALLGPGCLVTDWDIGEDPAPTPDAGVNRSPQILIESIEPSDTQIVRLFPPNDCRAVLQIRTVLEEDLDDALEVRWFDDFTPSRGMDNAFVAGGTIPPTGTVSRLGGSASQRTIDPTLFRNAGMHTVTIAISDGFSDRRDPMSAADGNGVAHVTWAVDTTHSAGCDGVVASGAAQ